MLKSVEAIYDGEVFRPAGAVELAANTRVRLIVETFLAEDSVAQSFLELAADLELDGPEDWSLRLEDYLYALHDPDDR